MCPRVSFKKASRDDRSAEALVCQPPRGGSSPGSDTLVRRRAPHLPQGAGPVVVRAALRVVAADVGQLLLELLLALVDGLLDGGRVPGVLGLREALLGLLQGVG